MRVVAKHRFYEILQMLKRFKLLSWCCPFTIKNKSNLLYSLSIRIAIMKLVSFKLVFIELTKLMKVVVFKISFHPNSNIGAQAFFRKNAWSKNNTRKKDNVHLQFYLFKIYQILIFRSPKQNKSSSVYSENVKNICKLGWTKEKNNRIEGGRKI
jgi:hypothetical protein